MARDARQPLSIDKASVFASLLQLRDVVCIGIEGRHVGLTSCEEAILGYTIPIVDAPWEVNGQSVKVIFPFTVDIDSLERLPGKKPDVIRTTIAKIQATMRLDYQFRMDPPKYPIGFGEDDLSHYVGISGYMHAWPYLRAEVQWLTGKLGFPPLVLPVIVSGHAATRVVPRRASDIERALATSASPTDDAKSAKAPRARRKLTST